MEESFLAEPQRIVAAIRDRGTEVEDLGYKMERDHRFHLQGRRDGGDTYRRCSVRHCSPLAACLEIDADPLHLKLFQCLEKFVAAIRLA